MSAGHQGHRSVFRAANLQAAQQLLEELQQTPISYQPKVPPPDARGYSECGWTVCRSALTRLIAVSSVFSALLSHHAC